MLVGMNLTLSWICRRRVNLSKPGKTLTAIMLNLLINSGTATVAPLNSWNEVITSQILLDTLLLDHVWMLRMVFPYTEVHTEQVLEDNIRVLSQISEQWYIDKPQFSFELMSNWNFNALHYFQNIRIGKIMRSCEDNILSTWYFLVKNWISKCITLPALLYTQM